MATNVWLTLDIHNLGIALNLIEKQQKEIEELKIEKAKRSWLHIIKAKIEEIDKILERNLLVDRLRDYFEAQKEVLQSLLKKE